MRKIIILLALVVSLPLNPLQAQDDEDEAMRNVELVERYFEGINGQNFEPSFYEEIFAEFFAMHVSTSDTELRLEPIDLASLISHFAGAFPNGVYTVKNMSTTKEIVMAHYSFVGTHGGVWNSRLPNFPICRATDNEVSWEGVFVFRFEDGLVAEMWEYWDNPLVLQHDEYCG